jgi:hypothetical protein
VEHGGTDTAVARPKLGGWAGQQLRFLSVSRGQSVITDLEQGSLAVNRRRTELPPLQRMGFHGRGFSLGYMKPRGSPAAAELFFLDPEARLCARQRLPAAAIEAAAGAPAIVGRVPTFARCVR